MTKDEQITALREALADYMAAYPPITAQQRAVAKRVRQALAATEPEAEGSECHEGCEDPQCPYAHPRHQGESR